MLQATVEKWAGSRILGYNDHRNGPSCKWGLTFYFILFFKFLVTMTSETAHRVDEALFFIYIIYIYIFFSNSWLQWLQQRPIV